MTKGVRVRARLGAALLAGAALASGLFALRAGRAVRDDAPRAQGACDCRGAPFPRPPAYVREAPEPFAWRCVEGPCSSFTSCSEVARPAVALTLRPRSASDLRPDLWLGGVPAGERPAGRSADAPADEGAGPRPGDGPADGRPGPGPGDGAVGAAPGTRVELSDHFDAGGELYQWVDFRGYSDWGGACAGDPSSQEKGGAVYIVADRLRVVGRRATRGGVTLRVRRLEAGERDFLRGFAVLFETLAPPPPPDEACRAEMAREGFAHPAQCFQLWPGAIVHEGGRRHRVVRAVAPRGRNEGRVELAPAPG